VAGLCWDVFGIFGSRRSDNTNRCTFQPSFYGRAHANASSMSKLPGPPYVTCDWTSSSSLICPGLVDDEGREGRNSWRSCGTAQALVR
jgi:hypothetical protein